MVEGAAQDGGSIGAIQDFVLSRELAEIYLLLDNISSTKGKTIPATIDDPIFQAAEGQPAKTWLEQVCEIAWPPEPDEAQYDAINAAKLIRAKDALNEKAAPATGASIAFTLLMSGEVRDDAGFSWSRLWRFASAQDKDVARMAPGHANPPSRASLAVLAYPSYARKARRYRWGLMLLLLLLVTWLFVTCLLSWDVATGSSLLNRANAVKASSAVAASTDSKLTGPTTSTAPPPGQAPSGASASSKTSGFGTPAAPGNIAAPSPPAAASDGGALWLITTDNLRQWLAATDELWLRKALHLAMGARHETADLPADLVSPASARRVGASPIVPNVEWATVFIGVLAGTVLPIFYGLLGAGAAVVRMVSAKMRDSTLMPRDIALAYMRLSLGAVIGACVGLFVTSDGNAAQSSGGFLGAVHLSASALCFVAGFGVEGVFVALETFVGRVFNLGAPSQPGAQ